MKAVIYESSHKNIECLMTAFICNHAYIGFNRRIHVQ